MQVDGKEFDFICLCEHWLTDPAIVNYVLPNYNLANFFCRSQSVGGGVLIYVKNQFSSRKLPDIDQLSMEKICEVTAIEVENINIVLLCIYRSPSSQVDLFLCQFTKVLNILHKYNKPVFIYGDFNIDILTKDQDSFKFDSLIKSFGLKILVDRPTRISKIHKNSCLDNCITNDATDCSFSLWDTYMSDHMALVNEFCCKINKLNDKKTTIIKYRPFNELNISNCNEALKDIDWDLLLDHRDLDTVFDVFLEQFFSVFNFFLPKKTKTTLITNRDKKWFNSDLKKQRDTLNFFSSFNKQNKDINMTPLVNKLKNDYKFKIAEAKKRYYSTKVTNSLNKPKEIWNIVKNTTKTNIKTSSQLPVSSEQFNNFFLNIANNITINLPKSGIDPSNVTSKLAHNCVTLFLGPVDTVEVRDILRGLSNSTALDVFDLSNKTIKQLSEGIALPLSIIINKCFEIGEFPRKLKLSRVIPIHKKGDKSDPNNFRPISIVPVFSKAIEVSLNKRIIHFLELHNLLSPFQFGFRKQKSTGDALRVLVGRVVECFERGESVSAIFCDLSRAFDCVSHEILLRKLNCYGIRGIVAQLISSYLTDRLQMVSCAEDVSSCQPVTAGVPQGSILGPLLFLLYVNELPAHFSNLNTIQYADDTTLLDHGLSVTQLKITTPQTVNKLRNWFADNNLSLNLDKTEIFEFSLKIQEENKNVKFLGVMLDNKLSWKSHIKYLCNKLSSTLFLLRRISELAFPLITRTAYMGLFQSRISYGLILWGNSAEWLRVFRIQKSAIRIICRKGPLDSCRPLFNENKILTLPALFISQCVTYVRILQHEFPTVNSRHNYHTRYGDELLTPQHRLTLSQKSFLNISIKLFNCLPNIIKFLPQGKFKQKVKQLLLEICPYNVDEYYEYCARDNHFNQLF